MAATSRKPYRLRVSVRTLLVFVLLIGLAMGVVARRVRQARRQRIAVAQICGCGGSIAYDWQTLFALDGDEGAPTTPASTPPGPPWLRRLVGDDYFQSITGVEINGVSLSVSRTGCSERELTIQAARSFPQLRSLLISCYESGQPALDVVRELSELKTLTVFGDGFDGAGLIQLNRLAKLERIDIASGGSLSDDTLKQLSTFPKLKALQIECSSFSDQGLAHLPRFPKLQHLALHAYSDRITDAGLVHFQHMRHLVSLDLRVDGTKITERGLEHLANIRLQRHEYFPGAINFFIKGGSVSEADLARLRDKNREISTMILGPNQGL